jgi:hypothetical protein
MHGCARKAPQWLLLLALGFVIFTPGRAHAYAWMIRHDYTGCASCHVDPSGGGLLTAYGRAQSDLLLRMRYGRPNTDEPDSSSGFLFGLVAPPEWLNVGGSFRGLGLLVKTGNGPLTSDFILMQADAAAEVRIGGFRANASLGVVSSDGSAAAVAGNLVSREHYVGYGFADDTMLIRAGRINLPFGIRSIEHTLFVRAATRTDLNDTQQHGVAFNYSGNLIRAEIMAILGNYQLHPDAFRERGYSGYAEIAPLNWAAFGVSSLITHAQSDIYKNAATTRQAHGVFARVAPVQSLVFLAEGDLVARATEGTKEQVGYAAMLQADFEPIQGLHAIATGELYDPGASSALSWNAWLGLDWFFLPHCDLRADAMHGIAAVGNNTVALTAYMAQLHVFL